MDQSDCDLTQLYKTLDQFQGINVLFSRVRGLLTRTVLADMQPSRPYHLVDLGAGACDIPVWLLSEAEKRGLQLSVTAVDADPRIVKYANEKYHAVPGLRIVQADALKLDEQKPFDYLFANHFLHHLPDALLPGLIADAQRLSQRGFVLSDLKRSPWSYLAFSLIARMYRDSFAREDGLISIRKGFKVEDFQKICVDVPANIQTAFPGRIQLLGGCFGTSKNAKDTKN